MGQTFEGLTAPDNNDATNIAARLHDIKEEIAELRRVVQELCGAVVAVASAINEK